MHEYGDWLIDMSTMSRELERLLGHLGSTKPRNIIFSGVVWEPAADIYETEEEVVVVAELAGVDEGVEIELDGNILIIRGKRTEMSPQCRRIYYRMEIAKGPFEKGMQLPSNVDPQRARVFYEDGLLVVVLPKIQEMRALKVRIKAVSR